MAGNRGHNCEEQEFEQWMKQLEQGMEQHEQGMKQLEQGMKQGMKQLEQMRKQFEELRIHQNIDILDEPNQWPQKEQQQPPNLQQQSQQELPEKQKQKEQTKQQQTQQPPSQQSTRPEGIGVIGSIRQLWTKFRSIFGEYEDLKKELEKKCEECEILKEELQKKDVENQSLYAELNAEMRKYQGDYDGSKSATELRREYEEFFTTEFVELLRDIHGKPDKLEAREQLCSVFQAIYSKVSKEVVERVTEKLNDMFKVGAVDEAAANDMKRAYARLLSAAKLTGSDANSTAADSTPTLLLLIQTEIQSEVQNLPSQMSKENKKRFITRATEIAWSLVTAVPPLVPSCDEQVFREDLHEKSTPEDKCSSNYKLKYIRPVLHSKSLRAVAQKGCVKIANVDGAMNSEPGSMDT